jgi:hypothetical protein
MSTKEHRLAQRTVPLSLIDPNPFRHLDRYPICEDKVTALMASMERTGYWGNVVARKVGDRYQLAYGHHRRIAFERKFGEGASMDLIVKDLSDEDMLHMMADENMAEFGTNAGVERETIRAVVQAYADGKIQLERPGDKVPLKSVRSAPSFRPGGHVVKDLNDIAKPYTAWSVARFLGWMSGDQPSPRVRNALDVLEAEEARLVTKQNLEGLTSDQAGAVAAGATKIQDTFNKAAGIVGGKAGEKLKERGRRTAAKASEEVAATAAKRAADKEGYGPRDIKEQMARARPPEDPKGIPHIADYCRTLALDLDKVFGKDHPLGDRVGKLVKFREDLAAHHPDALEEVTSALLILIERAQRLLIALGVPVGGPAGPARPPLPPRDRGR